MTKTRRIGTRWAVTAAVALGALALVGTAWATGEWSAPVQLDQQAAASFAGYAAACPSARLCFDLAGSSLGGFQVGGSVVDVLDAGGGHSFDLNPGWQNPATLALQALTCPSARLCAAIVNYSYEDDDTNDFEYDVVVSGDPAAGAGTWKYVRGSEPQPDAISCPTAGFCALSSPGGLYVSSDPVSDSWTAVTKKPGFVAVSCPSSAFCAAVDATGTVWTSSDPTGGLSGWTESAATTGLGPFAATLDSGNRSADDNDGGPGMEALPFACSSPTLCVADPGAPASVGTVAVSTDPAGAGAWTAVQVSDARVTALGCVPGGSCIVGDRSGQLLTGSTAAGAAETSTGWTGVVTSYSGGINSVSCTSTLCVAAPISGGAPLLATPRVGAGAWSWQPENVERHAALTSISCPAATECVATDSHSVYRSDQPAAAAAAWTTKHHSLGGPILDSSCWSAKLCLAAVSFGGNSGNGNSGELESFHPDSPAQRFASVSDGSTVGYVTCAQRSCVSGSPAQGWSQTSTPADARSWRQVKNPIFDVTCLHGNAGCVGLPDEPSSYLGGADVSVASRRTGPWRTVAVDPGEEITGLSCTARGACVIVDAAGHMRVSADPLGAAAGWHSAASDPDGFNGVACPTAQRCLAVDDDGRLVSGRP